MPSTHLNLKEDDVVRLALDFLNKRDLHITQLSLERETGVINGNYSDDVLYLRQLILDGQWDDVLEFIQPLSALKAFEANKFNYAILRHKYIELLCIRSEIKAYNNVENIVDDVVKVLSDLEKIAPSKEEYSNLCLLLTIPTITDHIQFKKWNPSNARVQCFHEVYPLVEQFLPLEKKSSGTLSKCARNDRLMQLLIKGILYESCVNYCQAKATGSKEAQSNEITFSRLLDGSGFDESDLSLLSWLQSIPAETFSVPFEQRMLNVDVEKLERPSLHTSWTEHMLVTPIKPRTFPHLAMPFRRPRSAADAMTRSLRPLPDGAPRHPAVMALSAIDYGPSSSYAGFHLTGIKGSRLMNTSVDRLFENNNGESMFNGLKELKSIDESSKNTETPNSVGASTATTPEHRGQDFSASSISNTAPSNERSSVAERAPPAPVPMPVPAMPLNPDGDFRRDLKEYQRMKQRECDYYLRHLRSPEMGQQTVEPYVEAAPGIAPAHIPPVVPTAAIPDNNRDQSQFIRNNELAETPAMGDAATSLRAPTVAQSLYYTRTEPPSTRSGALSRSDMKSKPTHYVEAPPYRPWPPLARQTQANFYFRPPDPMDLRNFKTASSKGSTYSDFSGMSAYSNKSRDYYFLSPSYRSAGTPTPSGHMEVYAPRERQRAARVPSSVPATACPCSRSRSLEDVRTEVVTEWEDDDENGNRIVAPATKFNRTSYKPATAFQKQGYLTRHSMENLADKPPQLLPPKRISAFQAQSRNGTSVPTSSGMARPEDPSKPSFRPVTILEDIQAVRCAEFHPNGKLYAVGSNTKTLRICTYPKLADVKDIIEPTAPTVLLKRTKHHKGSIYCIAWSPAGDLLATGSNDKTVKLMKFDSQSCNLEGQEVELTMHDGTVRDICFIEDTSNMASLLVSGGAGDCKIYVTDCATGKTFQALSGHSSHILSLYHCGGAMFVSGSQDKTVRFWDLRTGSSVNTIAPPTSHPSKGAAVTSLCVDPSGRLLVWGHDDGVCALYDVRGSRVLQRFAPHSSDVRSVRFSPGAYYLLTAGYDGRVALTDMQGDLTRAPPSVQVARHPDKVISARWHPEEFSFLSTSADKTAVLWTIPPV